MGRCLTGNILWKCGMVPLQLPRPQALADRKFAHTSHRQSRSLYQVQEKVMIVKVKSKTPES